jgi:hypothetical protein
VILIHWFEPNQLICSFLSVIALQRSASASAKSVDEIFQKQETQTMQQQAKAAPPQNTFAGSAIIENQAGDDADALLPSLSCHLVVFDALCS